MSIENKDSQILKQTKKPKTKKEKKRNNDIGKNQKKKIKLSKRNKREEEEIQKMIFPAIYKSDGSIDTELLIDILGNKIDRKIIIKLSKVPRYASDLAIDLGISKPAIKKHLDRLEEMGIIIKANPDNASEKRQYYCLNPDINISLTMDLSPNYFKYQATNTKYITEAITEEDNYEEKKKYTLQVSVFGDKSEDNENARFIRDIAKKTAQNEALLQLGRALRNIELQIKELEEKRYELIARKNMLIRRIKDVINSWQGDRMEREIVFSFFFKLIESMGDGISIKEFLQDIILPLEGSRAGVNFEEHLPEAIIKQKKRMLELEQLLMELIKDLKFIETKIDEDTGETHIIFGV